MPTSRTELIDASHSSDYDGRPMANDDIGAAAAVEALKITAANNQQSGGRPQQGGRPQGGFLSSTNVPQDRPSSAQQSGRPSGGKPQGRPQGAESGSEDDSGAEDEGPAAKPQAPTGGGGPQDKIVSFFAIFERVSLTYSILQIALAMSQAGKLFDKKGGGDGQGKTQGEFFVCFLLDI